MYQVLPPDAQGDGDISMPPANGNPKLALGVKKTFGEWKMGSYFSFFPGMF